MSSRSFGLELNLRLAKEDIKKKEDVMIVMVHWFIVKFGFRCIGLGDDQSISEEDEIGSELLPEGWSGSETYSLRYVYNKKLYILKGVRSDDILIINLLHVPDLNVSNLIINVPEVVKATKGEASQMVPELSNIIERISKELVEPVTKKVSAEATTQTAVVDRPSHPLHDVPAPYPGADIGGVSGPFHSIPDPLSAFGYGRSDLDPLGIGRPGGGMIFDPLRVGRPGEPPGGFPRGRVPGARFDPIGPPGRRWPRGMGPDADHLPPPGYDDMFM